LVRTPLPGEGGSYTAEAGEVDGGERICEQQWLAMRFPAIWKQRNSFGRSSDRVSETTKQRGFRRDEDLAKVQEAFRIAGMPE